MGPRQYRLDVVGDEPNRTQSKHRGFLVQTTARQREEKRRAGAVVTRKNQPQLRWLRGSFWYPLRGRLRQEIEDATRR
jgi:hypothetical protein